MASNDQTLRNLQSKYSWYSKAHKELENIVNEENAINLSKKYPWYKDAHKGNIRDVIEQETIRSLEDKYDWYNKGERKARERISYHNYDYKNTYEVPRIVNDLVYSILDEPPKYGDVIFADRGIYKHFGVYIGNEKIIHFATKNDNFDAVAAIVHETSIEKFSSGNPVSVLNCPQNYSSLYIWKIIAFSNDYKLQSPHETVKRAKSQLGMRGLKNDGYNLVWNNCEHFALWCKTNVSESRQIVEFLDKIFG